MHYVVDHTPALYCKTAYQDISKTIAKYINELQVTMGEDISDVFIGGKNHRSGADNRPKNCFAST